MSTTFHSDQVKPLRQLDDLLKDVAHLTGMPLEHIEAQVQELDFPVYQFEKMLLVSPDIVEPLIDQWYAQIKSKLTGSSTAIAPSSKSAAPAAESVQENGSSAAPAQVTVEAEAEPEAVEDVEDVEDTEDVDGADENGSSATALELPKGYSQQVSNRYGPTLEKLLPQDVDTRVAYLRELAEETEAGQNYLGRLANVICKKYKGRTGRSTAYKGLLTKAQDMLEQIVAGDAILDQIEQSG
jgi:hypothetical protein